MALVALAVGVVPAMAPAALGAVFRIPSLAAEDLAAVRVKLTENYFRISCRISGNSFQQP